MQRWRMHPYKGKSSVLRCRLLKMFQWRIFFKISNFIVHTNLILCIIGAISPCFAPKSILLSFKLQVRRRKPNQLTMNWIQFGTKWVIQMSYWISNVRFMSLLLVLLLIFWTSLFVQVLEFDLKGSPLDASSFLDVVVKDFETIGKDK